MSKVGVWVKLETKPGMRDEAVAVIQEALDADLKARLVLGYLHDRKARLPDSALTRAWFQRGLDALPDYANEPEPEDLVSAAPPEQQPRLYELLDAKLQALPPADPDRLALLAALNQLGPSLGKPLRTSPPPAPEALPDLLGRVKALRAQLGLLAAVHTSCRFAGFDLRGFSTHDASFSYRFQPSPHIHCDIE